MRKLVFSCAGALNALALLRRVHTLSRWSDVEARLVDKKPDVGACRVGTRWIALTLEERAALTLVPPTAAADASMHWPVRTIVKSEPVPAAQPRELDSAEMCRLRSLGWTYSRIGKLAGMSPEGVRYRVRIVRDAS
jgi:hypothetical protein